MFPAQFDRQDDALTPRPFSSLRLLSNMASHADVAIFGMYSEVLGLVKLRLDDKN